MLIQAGSGGMGHFAIQIAKVHFKAHVVATGGPANQQFMKVRGRSIACICTMALIRTMWKPYREVLSSGMLRLR